MSIRTPGQFRGVEERDIASRQSIKRDPRRLSEKIYAFINSNEIVMAIITFSAIVTVIFPFFLLASMILIFGLYGMRISSIRKHMLPARLPISSRRKDKSDPIPGTKDRSHFMAGGIFHVGNERNNDQELWLADKDVLTHFLIFGTTGAGKTETLVSLAFNAIALGSGLFYIDPKAAPKLAFQIYVMSRLLGREHDFLVLNYSVKSKSEYKYNPKRITNSTNSFSMGSAEALSELLTALIPTAEGENAVFSNNAQTMIKSLMYGLVEKRNSKELSLSIERIREYVTLNKYIELATDKGITVESRNAMQGYLSSVGWKDGMSPSKLQDVSRSHGFSLAYFSLALASLTDTYGHIYLKAKGELDNTDVIKYRRIAVTLLPSLEMSPASLKNVGQITLSSVRNATSVGLGDKLEGTVEDVIDSLPTNSPVPGIVLPFLSVTDEYAAIPTPGYAEVLTQGRGLGIAAIVASQDYAGIKGADETGAKQIVANTKFKMIMAMDDPEDTWSLVETISGKVDVTVVGGYESKNSNYGNYSDDASVKIESRAMVDIKDLQSQIEGEFHGFFKGKLIRGQSFYANPQLPKKLALKINHKIGIEDIDKKVIEARYGKIKEMTDNISVLINHGGISKKLINQTFNFSDNQKRVLKGIISGFKNPSKNPNDRAITALMLVDQMTKTSDDPVAKMLNAQKEANRTESISEEESNTVKKVVKEKTAAIKAVPPSEPEEDDTLPFGGLLLSSDFDEEEDEETEEGGEGGALKVEYDLKDQPNKQLQKKVYRSLIEGGKILSSKSEQKTLKEEVKEIEKAINPDADMDELDQKMDKELSFGAEMEKPLPGSQKDEENMLNDVQKILSVVKKSKSN